MQSHADDTQLYFQADPTAMDNKVQQLVGLKKSASGSLYGRHTAPTDQASHPEFQTVRLAAVNIQISTEAMCPGVLLDSALTFAPHARRLSSNSFHHLQQMKTVRRSLTDDDGTMVHAFVTRRVHTITGYSILYRASAVHIQNLQSVLSAAEV